MTPMTDEVHIAVAETDVEMGEPLSNGHSPAIETYGSEDGSARATATRELQGIVESLLFVSQEPLSIQRLTAVIGDVSKAEVVQALQVLGEELALEGRGIRLAEIAGGFRLVTKQEYASWIKRMDKSKSTAKLSRSALESLAIIAYKQPIVRAEIEEIRGVEASGVVRTLLERKLVRIVGRKEVPGRPIMYGTTKFFLEHFGLNDLSQLPPLREFRELGESEQAMLPMDEVENLTTNGTAEIMSLPEADLALDQPAVSFSEEETECSVAEAELTDTAAAMSKTELEVEDEAVTEEATVESVLDRPEPLFEVAPEYSAADAEAEVIETVDEGTETALVAEGEPEVAAEAAEIMTEAVSELAETVIGTTEQTLEVVVEIETEAEDNAAVETTLETAAPISDALEPLSSDDTTEQR